MGANFNISMTFCLVKVLIMGFVFVSFKHSQPINGEMLCQKDEIMAMVSSSS